MNVKITMSGLSLALFFAVHSVDAEQAGSDAASKNRRLKPLPAPPGWVLYPAPEADSASLRCAGFSGSAWSVSLVGGNVKINPRSGAPVDEPLPFEIRPKDTAAGLGGDRRVKRVKNGWLIGFDAGEFGGALWWFSANGGKRKKLIKENVLGLVESSAGVLVLVGIAHFRTDKGEVLRARKNRKGDWQVTRLADLGGEPKAFAKESPDSLLVLTNHGLLRVLASGKVERLFTTRYGGLYPNSMTLSKTGVIHFGMRHFVTRLTPADNAYKEEWFVPADCRRFELRERECVCI
ncbi:MAG: hypothetical protein KKH28_11935 [Elusimicrobia bacterium]|nr:hypothetical protein [Elusimicrobiota bacterium]